MTPPIRPARYADVVKAIDHVIEGFTLGGRIIDLERNPNSKYAVLWRCRTEVLELRQAIADQLAINRHLQNENYRLTKELECTTNHVVNAADITSPAHAAPILAPSFTLPPPISSSTEDGPRKST